MRARITHGSPRHQGCVGAQVRVEAVADGSTGDILQVSETLPSSRLQVNEPAYRAALVSGGDLALHHLAPARADVHADDVAEDERIAIDAALLSSMGWQASVSSSCPIKPNKIRPSSRAMSATSASGATFTCVG